MARPHLPAAPRVVEAACGPGAALPVLREQLPAATLQAFDLHPPFVEQARARQVPGAEVFVGDMTVWAPDAPADLVWCEGAVYFLGVRPALERFRTWLRPGGLVVFSDAVWTVPPAERPAAAVDMWEEYPGMRDIAGCLDQVADAGFEVVDSFPLPAGDWSEHYYGPIDARIEALRAEHADDPEALAELDEHAREGQIYRACGHSYTYLMVVARLPTAR